MNLRDAPRRILPLVFLPLLLLGAQQSQELRQMPKPDLTVRAAVNLVQTDVMVSDRQGRFVTDLNRDQFELQIDGKRQTVSFCELVSSGSKRDGALWTSTAGPANMPARLETGNSDMGRRLIFFVDDWHLSADSLARTRAALTHLIDTEIGVSDSAGIFSASGGIGFLQQLTENRGVLRAAAEKLTFFNPPIVDKDQVPMSEAQALAIEQNNQDVLNYFIDAIMASQPRNRPSANAVAIEKTVRRRALALAAQATEVASRTLLSLNRVLRVFSAMPGRKVIFFLSDGFVLQSQQSETLRMIRDVTDTAARAGIVIYSLDTRGLIVDGPDAANPVRPDTSGRLTRNAVSEVTAAQDALNALAADTGGTFLKNTNALDAAIARTMEEISRYYLLGWYLDRNLLEPNVYRSIHVGIKGRPDLKVRVRQAKVDLTQLAMQGQNATVRATPARTNPSEALLQLLRSPLPTGVLPVSFYAGYDLKSEKGFCLAIALQTAIEDGEDAAAQPGVERKIDLAGMVSNLDGETVTSFSDSLTIPAPSANQPETGDREWIYSGAIPVKPGIYQVRVALRDSRTGRSASSLQWLEIPELVPARISLSSIFMTEARRDPSSDAASVPNFFDGTSISIKRRFQSSSHASYFLHAYSLERNALLVQTKVYRGNQMVSQSGFEPLKPSPSADSSPALIRGQLSLEPLTPGSYVLEILVKDTTARPPATQRIHFWIQ
jgi:VWFA-related protein